VRRRVFKCSFSATEEGGGEEEDALPVLVGKDQSVVRFADGNLVRCVGEMMRGTVCAIAPID